MIWIPELNLYIEDIPRVFIDVKVKNILRKNLDRGYCIFIIPERFDYVEKNQKNIKKYYKSGFLYDLLTVIYPSMEKQDKHKIIDQKYHMFVTYRQFFTLIENYEKNREKFYSKDGFQ